mgnify:CR=1 FL=1
MSKRVLIVSIISLLILVPIAYLLVVLELQMEEYLFLMWFVAVISLLVVGFRYLSKGFDRWMPWKRWGGLRFVVQLLSVLAYSLLAINSTYYGLKEWLTKDPATPDQFISMNLLGALIIVPFTAFYFGFYFLRSWQSSEVRNQTLEKENLKTQLDSLKNHLDPHFLFNNLNILSALIEKDNKEAPRKFLEKFAEVYRFLLQNKNSELVDLGQELKFLDSYYYLIQSRYEDMVAFDNQLDAQSSYYFIPPFTLQMLFENAVKHNTITAKRNLRFELVREDSNLVVRNNINPKLTPVESHKSGLDNIKQRFKYFTDQEVQVSDDGNFFTVRLPLIEVEEA